MEYISVKEAAARWGIDPSNIGKLARKGRIDGAKIVGRNWLIPSNAPKPLDGRTRQAKSASAQIAFRFPLFANFEKDDFVPPLTPEEAELYCAQKDFFICNFQEAKSRFEQLTRNAGNIYVKICAHFFMCILSAVYDPGISWDYYYGSMNLLLSQDFPYKQEMKLLPLWLDIIIGQFMKILNQNDCEPQYEYHPSAWNMHLFLSSFQYFANKFVNSDPQNIRLFETMCLIMERDGYYVEAQEMHLGLFAFDNYLEKEAAAEYHLRKLIDIAYRHDLYYVVADTITYYSEAVNNVLSEYPAAFAERIRREGRAIYEAFSAFSEKVEKSNVYSILSQNDFRLVFYAIKGYTNKQIAGILDISERTVTNRYNAIYDKMGIDGKQELVAVMKGVFGDGSRFRETTNKI